MRVCEVISGLPEVPLTRGERELIAVTLMKPERPKLLKTWSGRWDSNPRRPAWEDAGKLKTKEHRLFCGAF
jgi:hypothetical protein